MDHIVGKIDCIYDLRTILHTGQKTLKEIKARYENVPNEANDSN